MKNGYYLSTYLHVDPISHLLETGSRHDQNIALFHKENDNIELVRYWELERFTGLKMHTRAFYSYQQAEQFINMLLSEENLSLDDMVEVWGTPGLPGSQPYLAVEDYPSLSNHNISHLFSALLLDTEVFHSNNMIGLSVDAGPDGILDASEGDKKYYAGCVKQNDVLDIFPINSPGMLWALAKERFHLREGTLMALASASKSEMFLPEKELMIIEDSSTWVQVNEYIDELIASSEKLSLSDQGRTFNYFDSNFSERDNKISMVMKEIQKMSYRMMEDNINRILQRYDINPEETYLALAGGFTLNCPTNSYLMNKFKFKGMMAPPCVNDCGMTLGMGLYNIYQKMNGSRMNFNLKYAYYGPEDNDLQTQINNEAYSQCIKDISNLEYTQIVEDIRQSPIVWFYGASEIGPRALGHRSLIGDPTLLKTKDYLNVVKEREWWRPVAPIVLEDDVEEWFVDAYKSPFMLNTFTLKEQYEAMVPSIIHLDNSARVQTLDKETDPVLYEVIHQFKLATGVPMVCNTSLNGRGEPIIQTIEEALHFALTKEIEVVYINGVRLKLGDFHLYPKAPPKPRSLRFHTYSAAEKKELLDRHNPHQIPEDVLLKYKNRELVYNLSKTFDLTLKQDADELVRSVGYMENLKYPLLDTIV